MKNTEPATPAIDALLSRPLARARKLRPFPESTYRLQLHKGFTFDDAIRIVPYLARLGITHCYASPYLRSTSGSMHGYDVVEHGVINPEIGGEAGLNRWVDTLRQHGMSHILDLVPNHAGVGSNDNPWWNDLLENGPSSRHANFFDIDWNGSPRESLHGRVLLPLLGEPYAACLEKGQLKIVFDPKRGTFSVHYYKRIFPLSPCGYGRILGHRIDELKKLLPLDDPPLVEYLSLLTAVANLPDRCDTDPRRIEDRYRESEHAKFRLAELSSRIAAVCDFIQQNVAVFNGAPGDSASFDLLDNLLTHQCFRLSYWANASDEINYRRFFDVNDLAALSMERQEVVEATHELILRLLAQGKIAGVRIDHPDGLFDPKQYLQRLQKHFITACARAEVNDEDWPEVKQQLLSRLKEEDCRELYIVVEKILALGEPLPSDWPVNGTSGYDFLNMVNGLFVDPAGEEALTRTHTQFTGDKTPFKELAYHKKCLILDTALASELHMLTDRLDRLAQTDRHSRDFTFNGLRTALREVITCFPVYRSYISAEGASQKDRREIDTAIDCAISRNPGIDPSVFHFVRDVLLRDAKFAGKFQQLTSPVTAKGVEDTAFYIDQRLISLNEVGGDPGQFGIAPDALHAYFKDRQAHWPSALSALSTHDTKRSEDVRARINVLSEMPEIWCKCVMRWREINRAAGAISPDEEYLLYQTLIGAWPIEIDRIQKYMLKAIREAKLRSSWGRPNAQHEETVNQFVARILENQEFLEDFRPFQERIAHFGLINTLSQTLLRIAAPGVPDTYQGTEIIDLSLVDPDNRRPVDYERRRQLLESGKENHADAMKLHVTRQALNARRNHAPLFSSGEYLPLKVTGPLADHVFAFARRHQNLTAICVVPRLISRLTEPPAFPVAEIWRDTRIIVPEPVMFRNILTDEPVQELFLRDILKTFPVALLLAERS